MIDKESKRVAIYFILVIMLLYAWRVYDSFFDSSPGYAYHPGSDRIFALQLKPTISIYDKWAPLIPFKSLQHNRIGSAKYLGELSLLVQEYEADRELMLHDFEAWKNKNKKKLDETLARIKRYEHDSWFVSSHHRYDLPVADLLPPSLSHLTAFTHKMPPEVFASDIVVARRTLGTDFTFEPAVIEILRESIIIRGHAAYKVMDLGLDGYD